MSDSDLTPEQDESVRALLASAKHTDPMPPDVVARLDAVLADLSSERSEVRAPVVTLASRRRRRVSSALLAAAAVVVLGVGVTQVLPDTYESSDSTAGAGSEMAEDQAAGSDSVFGAEEPESAPGATESQQGPDEKSGALSRETDEVVLDSRTPLRRQVRSLPSPRAADATLMANPGCLVDRDGSQAQVEVTYDGTPGVLVYRAPAAGRQQVDLFLCGEPDSFASVTIKSR